MREFISLTAAIEAEDGFNFDKKWADLSKGLRQRIERDLPNIAGACTLPPKPDLHPAALGGNIWDELAGGHRRLEAHRWDLENDPDIDEYRQRLWDLDRNIEEMEAAPAISPSEKVVKRKELARLRQEWAAVEAAVDARLDKTPSSPAGSVEQASTEPGNGEQPPPARVASDATIAAWMGDEIVYRQKSGGDPRRDAIVLAAKENFPHLTRQRAKRLFTGLDITLKAKRGPKGPRISGQ